MFYYTTDKVKVFDKKEKPIQADELIKSIGFDTTGTSIVDEVRTGRRLHISSNDLKFSTILVEEEDGDTLETLLYKGRFTHHSNNKRLSRILLVILVGVMVLSCLLRGAGLTSMRRGMTGNVESLMILSGMGIVYALWVYFSARRSLNKLSKADSDSEDDEE